jgi:predicted nucleic acid-binding Zn finger protein
MNLTIQGSGDNVYDVVLDDADSTCSCPAFKYSGEPGEQDCKHLRKLWDTLEQALTEAGAQRA